MMLKQSSTVATTHTALNISAAAPTHPRPDRSSLAASSITPFSHTSSPIVVAPLAPGGFTCILSRPSPIRASLTITLKRSPATALNTSVATTSTGSMPSSVR